MRHHGEDGQKNSLIELHMLREMVRATRLDSLTLSVSFGGAILSQLLSLAVQQVTFQLQLPGTLLPRETGTRIQLTGVH